MPLFDTGLQNTLQCRITRPERPSTRRTRRERRDYVAGATPWTRPDRGGKLQAKIWEGFRVKSQTLRLLILANQRCQARFTIGTRSARCMRASSITLTLCGDCGPQSKQRIRSLHGFYGHCQTHFPTSRRIGVGGSGDSFTLPIGAHNAQAKRSTEEKGIAIPLTAQGRRFNFEEFRETCLRQQERDGARWGDCPEALS